VSELRKTFDSRAQCYDQWIHAICPDYDCALESLLAALPPHPHFILELGCGTGNLTVRLAARYPTADITVVDLAPAMLAVTRAKIGEKTTRVHYCESDFLSMHFPYTFDCIVSSIAIHHLATKEKERLFESILRLLVPGGAFYLMDSVAGATREEDARNYEAWIAHMRAAQLPEEELQGALKRRRTQDKCDSLMTQLTLLKKIGFVDLDVIYKRYSIAVFGGRKY